MNRLKILLKVFIILLLITGCSSSSVESINGGHRQTIIKKVNKLYPDYKIEELDLEYTDFYSTVQSANKYNEAESATVVVKNKDEQRTLEFKRKFLGWELEFDEPDYGENVPDSYFVEISSSSVGKAVDMEEYVKKHIELGYWYIPFDDGKLYRKSGNGDSWYYYVKYYKNLYKTENGKVYEYNKETHEWEHSDSYYSTLIFYSNYDVISEVKMNKILETYRSD